MKLIKRNMNGEIEAISLNIDEMKSLVEMIQKQIRIEDRKEHKSFNRENIGSNLQIWIDVI